MALVVSTSRKHFGRLLSYLIDRKLKQPRLIEIFRMHPNIIQHVFFYIKPNNPNIFQHVIFEVPRKTHKGKRARNIYV